MWIGVVEMKGYYFLYVLCDVIYDKIYLGCCFFVVVLWELEVCIKEMFFVDFCCFIVNCFINSCLIFICILMLLID